LNRHRGFSIPEVLIASGLLGLLSAICFGIYALGLRSWTQMDAKTTVMSNLQLVQAKLSRELRASQLPSVTTAPDLSGVAFLSAGPEATRQTDTAGRLVWQDFVFFYHVPADERLYRKVVPYATADNTLLSTLEAYSGDPLAVHKIGGQVVAHDLPKFEATLELPDVLHVVIRAKSGKEEFELSSSYQLNP
jgi:prepilin-type N-terminal cleavage/methylation domain-containing protein